MKYKSAQEYAERQRLLLTNIKLYEVPFELAVRTVVALQTQRIFERGENSAGGVIGKYEPAGEDTGFYVNPKTQSPRAVPGGAPGRFQVQGLLPTRGNPNASLIDDPEGEHIFTERTYFRGVKGTKPGDPHRTTYVKSYKDYRNRIGRRIDRVDLVLTGELLLDFVTARLKGRAVTDRGGSILFQLQLRRRGSGDKRDHAEQKYGRIFALTAQERNEYFRTLRFELRRAVAELNGQNPKT